MGKGKKTILVTIASLAVMITIILIVVTGNKGIETLEDYSEYITKTEIEQKIQKIESLDEEIGKASVNVADQDTVRNLIKEQKTILDELQSSVTDVEITDESIKTVHDKLMEYVAIRHELNGINEELLVLINGYSTEPSEKVNEENYILMVEKINSGLALVESGKVLVQDWRNR